MAELSPARPCGCRTGLIFVRPCELPATALCSQCAQPLCNRHGRLHRNQLLCPACHARAVPDSASSFDSSSRDDRWSSSSYGGGSFAAADTFAGQGGEFGGGGASGGWEEGGGDVVAADDLADSPFSAADYAAFDAVSEYDRDSERGGGYDS